MNSIEKTQNKSKSHLKVFKFEKQNLYILNFLFIFNDSICHNPNLGLATKARACKGAGQKRSPGMWESENEHSRAQVSSHFGS
jgi:hypothetical protein